MYDRRSHGTHAAVSTVKHVTATRGQRCNAGSSLQIVTITYPYDKNEAAKNGRYVVGTEKNISGDGCPPCRYPRVAGCDIPRLPIAHPESRTRRTQTRSVQFVEDDEGKDARIIALNRRANRSSREISARDGRWHARANPKPALGSRLCVRLWPSVSTRQTIVYRIDLFAASPFLLPPSLSLRRRCCVPCRSFASTSSSATFARPTANLLLLVFPSCLSANPTCFCVSRTPKLPELDEERLRAARESDSLASFSALGIWQRRRFARRRTVSINLTRDLKKMPSYKRLID